MPLLDHFHPPLSQRRHWESFHAAWADAMARSLNADRLPPHYVAEAYVKLSVQVETDVGTFHENGDPADPVGKVAWQPAEPTASVALLAEALETIEVRVVNDEAGPRVVAAIELVSPANKDRAAHRRLFVAKCASYLQERVGLVVVDVVTERSGNLHRKLLDALQVSVSSPALGARDLYGAAYRLRGDAPRFNLDLWVEPLTLGAALPTLPLWLSDELAVPLDLEETYRAACAARRIG
ncbi:MAG: DUF4058 family protein [Planctomycetia bacterium]|nr:DUF4058 family protein [Planctomycetia bacterium]